MKNITDFNGRTHRLWWVPMITGILAIFLGIWCFLSPASSLPVFAMAFAFCLIAGGIFNLAYSFSNMSHSNWGWSLALGLIEIFCGGWMLTLSPEVMAAAFAYAIGIWVLIVAINAVCEAAFFSRFSGWWAVWMIILLIATIFFGFYFLSSPLFGGVAGWLWIGISLLCFGVWRISLAFQLRKINRHIKRTF